MMKKVTVLLVAISCLLLGTWNVAAAPALITEAHYYTGLLYYCDGVDGVVVLKDVDAMGMVNQTNTKTAMEAEYTEIPIVGPAIFKDGTAIPLEDCNFYPDSKVRVLITRNTQGELRVMQLKFL